MVTAMLLAGQPSLARGQGLLFREPVPWGYHNFFVLAVAVLALLWAAKVGYQIAIVAIIQRRLAMHRPLPLERMSLYAKDFQQLIRQHFNQILRMRRTVPPREVTRNLVRVHVQPESIKAIVSGHRVGIQCLVDASVPCSVRLYWGVSVAACNGLWQQLRRDAAPSARESRGRRNGTPLSRAFSTSGGQSPVGSSADGPTTGFLLELERNRDLSSAAAGQEADSQRALFSPAEYCARSAALDLPVGLGLTYRMPDEDFLDCDGLTFDLATVWPRGGEALDRSSVVPLAIAVSANTAGRREADSVGTVQGHPVGEAHTQVTFIKFRREEGSAALKPEFLQQVTLGDGGLHRVSGIYGFEDEAEGGDADCMICYDRMRSVLLLPCRHCSVCSFCLRSLRDERCPLCRSPFSAYMLFPLLRGASNMGGAEPRAAA